MRKHSIISKLLSGVMVLTAVVTMSSCSGFVDAVLGTSDSPSGSTTKPTTVAGIPSDASATPNPTLPAEANATIPNLNYSVQTVSGQAVIKFDMTGIMNPNETAEWIKLYGTGMSEQNVWLSIDGNKKGIAVVNTIDQSSQVTAADLVFLVDNSGSMGQEADAVANSIDAWAQKLSTTLDMKFACVGYSVSGYINGALDFTTSSSLSSYLSRSTGTSRTMGFENNDSGTALSAAASTYGSVYDECGVMALRFANDKFTYRKGVNRVYVNFTDEPNQPNYKEEWSTNWVKNPDNWPTTLGTIHTVYSADTTYTNWKDLYKERPWLLSDYTGGSKIFTTASFAGVTLDDLPVTGALQNSYVITLTNVDNLFDGKPHTVKITILSPNGTIRAEKEYVITFTK